LILNIGENIKKYRKNKFCRRKILLRSPALNNTTLINTLTKIEIGVIKKPSVFVMAKIAKALGVNIEELIK